MISPEAEVAARRAEAIYEVRLKNQLEKTHRDWFVAVDSVSGDYFLGKTILEAANAAKKVHPDRSGIVLRIGHKTAVEIGNCPL